jgi:GH18 family chitinase
MAVIPPQNPQDRIPNGPFNTELDFGLYSNTGGRVIFGDNFVVDPATGRISVAPLAPFNGTVYRVSAGAGLDTTPASGIVVTGSVEFEPLVTVTPGAYTYPIVSIDPYGRIYSIFNGITPVQTVTGTAPITVSGTSTSKNIGIGAASTTAEGAVALNDDLTDTSTNKALSAQGAYVLQQETGYLSSTSADQIFGGTINGSTGLVSSVSYAGAAYPGVVVGSPLPAPSVALEGLYFYISTPGNYTPPGGTAASVVKNDKIECVGGAWQTILCGYRPVAATTTTYGETILATIPETQALADNTKSVTPFCLSGMLATETQYGFVTLATNADTAPFLNGTKVITPANLGFVVSTPVQRGVVLLEDTYSSPAINAAPTANALRAYYGGAFLKASLILAKGDIIVGNGPADPVVLPLGPQSSQLVVDLTKPQGIDWSVPDSLSTWPVGSIIWYLNGDVYQTPEPWMPCDGRSLDASITGPYYELYDIVGTSFNLPGDAAGTFRVPDLRGKFVRGWSGSTQPPYPDQTPAGPTALDPGRGFITNQSSAYQQHNHGITDPGHIMPFDLIQHNHGVADPGHTHPNNGGSHYHNIGSLANAEVVGNDWGFYDGNANVSGGQNVSTAFTGVKIGSKATALTINNRVTGWTVNVSPTNITINNSPPVAPYPDESRPMNVALVPLIKYSYVPSGLPPGPPPFINPTYTLVTTPSPAQSGQTLTTNVTVTGVAPGTPLYWEMSGPGVTTSFFVSNLLTGVFTTDVDGLSTFTNELVTVLPGPGPYAITTKLYTDAARTVQVGNAPTVSVTQGSLVPTYSVSTNPLAVANNSPFTTTVTTTNVSAGTVLYYSIAGVSITSSFFTSNSLTGTATVNGSGVASFTDTVAASLPAGSPFTAYIRFYSDAARTTQVGSSQALTISSPIVKTKPKFGSYIDLYQYRNTGGVYPDGSYVGLNPNMRAANINTILPSLDQFYMFAEVQLYTDGKLYFGTNPGTAAALVLNAAGTDWANNTGTVSGGYVSPTNPDYAFSAYALKNSIYYLSQQSAWSTKNLFISIGGYNLSQFMDQAGNSAVLAQTAADQIAALVQITGAVGVDLDYEPVGQSCIPTNMALLCQKVTAAVKALNPAYEVHLTLIPALSQADPDLKVATAVACQAHVDQINVMTYDDPSNVNQPPYQPGSTAVYNHTGVGRSVQSVQWFIDAGVARTKLGMGIAGYGRNSGNGQAFTNSGTPYDQIVRVAGSAGALSSEFLLGRFNGVVPISNPNPTTQANYYSTPTNAIWGFDSIGTITEKVKSSSNMGLRAVFMWQLSNDYSDPASVLPAGNAMANFALTRGALAAIAPLP